jgi:hypothetical protein
MNYDHYDRTHMRLRIRKALLRSRDNSLSRALLLARFHNTHLGLIDEVIATLITDGLLTSTKGTRGSVIYTWQEEIIL